MPIRAAYGPRNPRAKARRLEVRGAPPVGLGSQIAGAHFFREPCRVALPRDAGRGRANRGDPNAATRTSHSVRQAGRSATAPCAFPTAARAPYGVGACWRAILQQRISLALQCGTPRFAIAITTITATIAEHLKVGSWRGMRSLSLAEARGPLSSHEISMALLVPSIEQVVADVFLNSMPAGAE